MKHRRMRPLKISTTAMMLVFFGLYAAQARNPYRKAFFIEYGNATGTVLDTVTSNPGHCGVCHYNFDGGGTRNPYGADIETRLNEGDDIATALTHVADLDSDGDGFTNVVEITSLVYSNTPTFPSLSVANDNSISNVDPSEIAPYLTPSTGVDTDAPSVTLISPNGGETVIGNAPIDIVWEADDGNGSGIAAIEVYVSLDGGDTYKHATKTLSGNSRDFTWFVSNRPTSNALIRVEAYDNADNEGEDVSDTAFIIISTNNFPTTLRDFDQPGTQPIDDSGLVQANPQSCGSCHGGYSEIHEPYRNWLGSMMAHASYDPIFKANLTIAQQDVPDSGDLCLRCHNSRGWLDGRSTPTDGSQMTAQDMFGVSCDLCHRLVNPHYEQDQSPLLDVAILESVADTNLIQAANGMYVFDPNSHRRGPFADSVSPHTDLYSAFHRDAAICGTCHDVSNPVFVRDGDNAEYVANTFDTPAEDFSSEILMPVERTYSEWKHSAYNTTNGVFAPQFAGNKNGGMVAVCQDCHMADIPGYGADPSQFNDVPLRQDLPHHDMTGGSTWLPKLMPTLPGFPYVPGTAEAAAITNGANRARYMLNNAARMEAKQVGNELKVLVINDTGHKLPTGYPEGRRIWINVRFYDESDALIDELGAYNYTNALLTATDTTVYEVHPGIGTNLYHTLTNLNPGMDIEPGPSLHFVLNNRVYEDNRIPPRGFSNDAYDSFGGAPVGHHYEDGQFWDETYYSMPEGAVRAHVQLYYQSTSREFVEFLYTNNITDAVGTNLYNLWVENERCPPVLMTEAFWPENFNIESIGWSVNEALGIAFNSISGYTYFVEYTDDLSGSNVIWKPFLSNGIIEATGQSSSFTDDFTTATSGSSPTNHHRFYRIKR